MNCPIWNTAADLLEDAGDYQVFDSPRSGGRYSISVTALGKLGTLNDNAKLLLTTWLCEQRHAGAATPRIDLNVLELLKSRRFLSVPRRLNAALLFVGRNTKSLGKTVNIDQRGHRGLVFLAETESRSPSEATYLMSMLRGQELIYGNVNAQEASVQVSAKGWYEVERLDRIQADSSQAFVAMWFNKATDAIYANAIAPALSATGYKPFRIDKTEHINKIDDEIIAEIRKSRFVVADFTCEPFQVRGGVYYEAGFARGLGIPVISTCKETSKDDLHFDTRQYAHILWENEKDLCKKLKSSIEANIGAGPLPKIAVDSQGENDGLVTGLSPDD